MQQNEPPRGKTSWENQQSAYVSGGFSRGSPVFVPPTDWPVSYELK